MVNQFLKTIRTQFHLDVTVTLCNIHHRLRFRPYSKSTGAGFVFCCCFFFPLHFLSCCCCWMQQRTLELQKKPYPFSKLWFLPGPQSPETVGQTLQRGRNSCWTVHWRLKLLVYNWVHKMHTSSLRATATPNRDWMHSGIGWFWVSGTIPNKRGFS